MLAAQPPALPALALADGARFMPSLADLPDDVIEEIAIRSHPLIALRKVVRFRLQDVAATRIARWFHQRRAELTARSRPTVGDRVICRWPAYMKRAPCYATVAASVGYHHGRLLWRIWLFDGTYVKMQASRMRRLEPWMDGVWGDSVGRTSALAAASVAREAATRATQTATAAMASTSSPAETALAVAVASAACTAAAAATSAATAARSSGSALALGSGAGAGAGGGTRSLTADGSSAVGAGVSTSGGAAGRLLHPLAGASAAASEGGSPLRMRPPPSLSASLTPRSAPDPENHDAEASSLLGVARGMREALAASSSFAASAPAQGRQAGAAHTHGSVPATGTDLTRLHEAALAAADAAAEAAAAAHAADAISNVEGTLPVTAGAAAAAATAAANVVAAIEELAGARANDLGREAGAAACSAASSAAAGAILHMDAAGRALNRSWGLASAAGSAGPSAPIEHNSSSAVVEQAAAMVRSASAAMLAQQYAGSSSGDSSASRGDDKKPSAQPKRDLLTADERAMVAAAMLDSLDDDEQAAAAEALAVAFEDSDDDEDGGPGRCTLQ